MKAITVSITLIHLFFLGASLVYQYVMAIYHGKYRLSNLKLQSFIALICRLLFYIVDLKNIVEILFSNFSHDFSFVVSLEKTTIGK